MAKHSQVEYSTDNGKTWRSWFFARGGKETVRKEVMEMLPVLKKRLNKGKSVNFVEEIEVRVEGEPILNGKKKATRHLVLVHTHITRANKMLDKASNNRELRKEDFELMSDHLTKAAYMVARLMKKEG